MCTEISTTQKMRKVETSQKAFRLLKSNFEILVKQMQLSELLGQHVSLVSDPQEEFLAASVAIELFLGSKKNNEELFEHLDELISARFFEQYYVISKNQASTMILELSEVFCDLLESVASKVTQSWQAGGMEQFFEVVDDSLPDGGCDFFRRNYGEYFSAPMLAS